MATEYQIVLKKKEYNSSTDAQDGVVVFDNTTNQIFVGGECFSSRVKNATYDSTTNILTITKTDSTTISLNFKDASSSEQANSLLAGLRDDINSNTAALTTLNGTGEGSVDKAIDDKLADLSSTVIIATNTNDIIVLKTTVDQANGILSNLGSAEITFAKVASTGSSTDVSVTYDSTTSNVQTAITDIYSRLISLSSNQLQYIIPTSNATTPNGYSHYYQTGSRYQGTLTASADTMNKIYVCRTTSGGDYHQIMTVKSATADTYSWIDLSTETIDLSGYIKSIIVNGETYTTTTDGTSITLADVITAITGENDITGGNTDYVAVIVDTSSASSGQKTATLTTKLKVQDISTSSSTANGVATSYNVKEYVQSNLTTIRTWTESDITE